MTTSNETNWETVLTTRLAALKEELRSEYTLELQALRSQLRQLTKRLEHFEQSSSFSSSSSSSSSFSFDLTKSLYPNDVSSLEINATKDARDTNSNNTEITKNDAAHKNESENADANTNINTNTHANENESGDIHVKVNMNVNANETVNGSGNMNENYKNENGKDKVKEKDTEKEKQKQKEKGKEVENKKFLNPKSASTMENTKRMPARSRRESTPILEGNHNKNSVGVRNKRKNGIGGLGVITTPSDAFVTRVITGIIPNLQIIVGHRYLLRDDRYGICRFYDGKWIGLELEVGKGDCDGTFQKNGKRNFICDVDKGVYVIINQVAMDCGKPEKV